MSFHNTNNTKTINSDDDVNSNNNACPRNVLVVTATTTATTTTNPTINYFQQQRKLLLLLLIPSSSYYASVAILILVVCISRTLLQLVVGPQSYLLLPTQGTLINRTITTPEQQRNRNRIVEEDLVVVNENNSNNNKNNKNVLVFPSLKELVNTHVETGECNDPNLVYIEDRWMDDDSNNNNNNNNEGPKYQQQQVLIPKIIHMTSKTRCVTIGIGRNVQLWKEVLPDYTFVFHNDAAVERLLHHVTKTTFLFPMLLDVIHCTISFTSIIDIWRGIVLYSYGGIYTDIDNGPGEGFLIPLDVNENDPDNTTTFINVTTIPIYNNSVQDIISRIDNITTTRTKDETNLDSSNTTTTKIIIQQQQMYRSRINTTDEAFFEIEGGGFLSQYFMASRRYHPLMYLLVQNSIVRLLDVVDIKNQYIPFVTGPGALKTAFIQFMGVPYDRNKPILQNTELEKQLLFYSRPSAGYYTSPIYYNYDPITNRTTTTTTYNVTVTIVDTRGSQLPLISRSNIAGRKHLLWDAMNMTHYQTANVVHKDTIPNDQSCLQRIYEKKHSTIAIKLPNT